MAQGAKKPGRQSHSPGQSPAGQGGRTPAGMEMTLSVSEQLRAAHDEHARTRATR